MASGKTYAQAASGTVVPAVPVKDPTHDPNEPVAPAVAPTPPASVAPKIAPAADYWTTITATSKSSNAVSSSESQSTSCEGIFSLSRASRLESDSFIPSKHLSLCWWRRWIWILVCGWFLLPLGF